MYYRSEELKTLEKEINPMLSEDPKVVFKHALNKIMEEEVQVRLQRRFRAPRLLQRLRLQVLRKSQIFQKLPPRSSTPEYYASVKNPICLDQASEYRKGRRCIRGNTQDYA